MCRVDSKQKNTRNSAVAKLLRGLMKKKKAVWKHRFVPHGKHRKFGRIQGGTQKPMLGHVAGLGQRWSRGHTTRWSRGFTELYLKMLDEFRMSGIGIKYGILRRTFHKYTLKWITDNVGVCNNNFRDVQKHGGN